MFWIVYAMKFQKTDKEEILCELRIALREKLRKFFIMVPSPKDKYYDILPVLLAQSIELALNNEVRTVSGSKNSTNPPKHTYDYECKQDLFQTVYYEILGFLPSAFFIEKVIMKYTKTENKMGINTSYFNKKKKNKNEKPPAQETGVQKNL